MSLKSLQSSSLAFGYVYVYPGLSTHMRKAKHMSADRNYCVFKALRAR